MEEYSEKALPPPPRKRFYKNKRYWIICGVLSAIITLVVVLLAVFVFFPKIAQDIMNKSGISVNTAEISFVPPSSSINAKRQDTDMNTTFYMIMSSKLTNTGPFAADIKFHNPIDVFYNDTLLLGSITLPNTHVAHGGGLLDATTPFLIANTTLFAQFAKEMLAQETFTWRMKGKLDITALSRTATVNLDKNIVLQGNYNYLNVGMNGFPNVTITNFNLPGNAPGGGITVELGTILVSPSPIGVQLGTIALQIGYNGVMLGKVTSENVTLVQGENNLMLKGTLVPQKDPANLDKIGVLFSSYVAGKMSNTTAKGLSCAPDGSHPIGWLSEGFQSVQLNVGLGLPQPMNIIQGVNMGQLAMVFNADTPYAPVTNAPAVTADYSIPFGFNLDITEVSQELKLAMANGSGEFAAISVPPVPAQSNQTSGKLQFAMNQIPITAIPGKEALFNDFVYSLSASEKYSFLVGGQVVTKTVTPIGNLTLSGITFQVPTSLQGLQFLNSTATTVNSVDVIGGTHQSLVLAINVSMSNPSDFSIAAGDVSFAFSSGGQKLGDVVLNNLDLKRGVNTVAATSTFDPKSSEVGTHLLSSFVTGQNNDVNIQGFEGSTPVASLVKALSVIDIKTTLPGLKSTLIQKSKLAVDKDSASTGIVHVQVAIANPFSAALKITSVVSSVTYKNVIDVGIINQDLANNPIAIDGHTTGMSDMLDMAMNVDPTAVANLMRVLAVDANLDTKPLDALYGMGGFHVDNQQDVQPDPGLFADFDLSKFVVQAMKVLKADLALESGLQVDDYSTKLTFAQQGVAVETDSSVVSLIPIVGQPIVQKIVDGAKLSFTSVILSSPTDQNFKVQMAGSITDAGPMAAEIAFPQPLTVSWQERVLGTVSMAAIKTKANAGADFKVLGDFTISDQAAMGDFAGFMINNDGFEWDIRTENVAVTALGVTFSNITMAKKVSLSGAKGFRDAVTINSFDLPSNDPKGGITMTAATSITNPSQVGFILSGAGFNAYYGDVLLGPLASDGTANFPPQAAAKLNMRGRLLRQSSQHGLDAVNKVFSNYLQGKDTPLTIVGDYGSGPKGQVGWLTKGFKAIKIENVILPGPKTPPTLIPSIKMQDLQIDFVKSAYAPPTGSTRVEAQVKNPFGFPLGVSSLTMDVTASYNGKDMAELKIPNQKATTSKSGLVTTQFSNVPFSSFDNAHNTFEEYLTAVTSKGNVKFGLRGTSNAVAATAIGAIPLSGIGFDVETALEGFNNFDGKTKILSLSIAGGTSEHILVKLSISMNNPSHITITLGDMQLSTIMNEYRAAVGDVFLRGITIKPGNNQFNAEMHMGGSNEKALKQLLSNYMTGAKVPLTVTGSQASTQIPSLKNALATVKLDTSMQGITDKLVKSTSVKATGKVIFDKKATTTIVLRNPLDTPFSIHSIEAEVYTTVGSDHFKVGHIDYNLPKPFTVPAKSEATTGDWPVNVDANAGQLLKLLGAKDLKVDLTQNVSVTVGGPSGFASVMYYYQNSVPTNLDFKLF
ncbi:hypothetical protein BX666DRAFT_2128544 [Dichotomocladium elegans]|nr:hypothetical protein BX666DRAFT_2128544 [Dichotomocladium elegans]